MMLPVGENEIQTHQFDLTGEFGFPIELDSPFITSEDSQAMPTDNPKGSQRRLGRENVNRGCGPQNTKNGSGCV